MNPFEIFNIPVQLNPDLKELRKKYIQLQQNSHIDRGGDEVNSESVNRAYEILKDSEKRVYFLISDLFKINLKDYPLSADFLMEMMEINDLILESDNKDHAEKTLSGIEANLNSEFQTLDNALIENGLGDQGVVLQIVDWFQRYKYFIRLRKNLQGIEEL